jgi:hypothetical protein
MRQMPDIGTVWLSRGFVRTTTAITCRTNITGDIEATTECGRSCSADSICTICHNDDNSCDFGSRPLSSGSLMCLQMHMFRLHHDVMVGSSLAYDRLLTMLFSY